MLCKQAYLARKQADRIIVPLLFVDLCHYIVFMRESV